MIPFPSLDNFSQTRQTLHRYAQAIGVVPRAHGISHPKWWHISLKLDSHGLTSDGVPLPNGHLLTLRLDLIEHAVVLHVSDGSRRSQPMTAGLTGTQMGDWVIAQVAELGLDGSFAREKFESDETAVYDPDAVTDFFQALRTAHRLFTQQKTAVDRESSPVQLWPHGFDLAFEWFGTRIESFEEEGEMQQLPAQLNLGFYPGDGDNPPYFYSNPWPFEAETLLEHDLPDGASWHTDGWEGSQLPYAAVADDPNGDAQVATFAQAVYKAARPTLMA